MSIDKLVIITGASAGIGAALATVFSQSGYFVGLISRQSNMLPNLNIKRAMWVSADVTHPQALSEAISTFETRFGSVDCLINNAGSLITGEFENLTPEQSKQMMDINVQGVMNGIHAVLPGMLERNQGTIINISSLADRASRPHNAVYAASKAAVKSLTESLRAAYAKRGIRFCNVAPAKVKTAMMQKTNIPDNELISPTEIADIILWLYQQPSHLCIRDIVITPTSYEQ